jgi:hypothetical protein
VGRLQGRAPREIRRSSTRCGTRKCSTQPAAIATATAFARTRDAVVFFDAGDVQANGFQIVEDDRLGRTFTETGASYMGWAVSALLATAVATNPFYGLALTGDGSFAMSPQILIDGAAHGARGTILLLDNRRMGAISGLQLAQYGHDHATHDGVEIDYLAWARAVRGVAAFDGGRTPESLRGARAGLRAPGLSPRTRAGLLRRRSWAAWASRPGTVGPWAKTYSGCATRSRCELRSARDVDRRRLDARLDGARIDVVDPATEETIDSVPRATAADLDRALAAAERAGRSWRATDPWSRSAVLRNAARLVRERSEAIACAMTEEQGKPLAEARAEIAGAADHFDWNADEARRIYGRVIEARSRESRLFVVREPIGPVAAFTAWNFPVLLPARKIAPALAAGCSMVLKPAEEAPRVAFYQGPEDAGLPGVPNVVTESHAGERHLPGRA